MVRAVWWWGARAEGKRDTPAAARCIEEGGQRTSWHGHVIACQDERTRFREPLFSACLTLTKNEPPQRAASSPRFACPASFYSFFVGQPSRRRCPTLMQRRRGGAVPSLRAWQSTRFRDLAPWPVTGRAPSPLTALCFGVPGLLRRGSRPRLAMPPIERKRRCPFPSELTRDALQLALKHLPQKRGKRG